MTITRNFSVLANGAGSANTLSLGGATLGSNALAVTGSSLFPGSTTITSAGLVGIGMTPTNILDITQNQNAATVQQIYNNSGGTGALLGLYLNNATSKMSLFQFGASYTTSGVYRADGTMLRAGGAGGLTLVTDTAQPIYFGINNAEVARFFTGGGLGINTTNQSLFTGGGFPILCGLSDSAGRLLRFGNSNLNGTSTGTFSKIEYSAGTGNADLTITNQISGGTANGAIVFTGSSEYARFDTSGNLTVGNTTANGRIASWDTGGTTNLYLRSSALPSSSHMMEIINTNSNGGAAITFQYFQTVYGAAGTIVCTTTNTAYTSSSDYRMKENVQPMTGGLSTIAALKPVIFDWIPSKTAGEGFIAHELQAVIPAAVSGEKDALYEDGSINAQGVDFGKIVPHLVAAVQELTTRLAALENK